MLIPMNGLKQSSGLTLGGGLLTAVYQPIRRIDEPGSPVIAVEALARWRHPVRGPIRPDAFVPVFGRTGQGQQLFNAMVRLVAQSLSGRSGSVPVSLNIDPEVPQVRHWHRRLLEILAAEEIPASSVWVELTQRVDPTGRSAWWYAGFESLVDAGVRLVLDDIGAGFDRTELLYRFPIHAVKLDRSVLSSMCALIQLGGERGRRASRYLASYADWCAGNDVLSIAEGISDAGLLRQAADHGWNAGQGFWLGRPAESLAEALVGPAPM